MEVIGGFMPERDQQDESHDDENARRDQKPAAPLVHREILRVKGMIAPFQALRGW
jgi:hypothetical protein